MWKRQVLTMVTIHQVRKVLGDDVANALYEHFAGQQLNIPKKQSSMLYETLEDRDAYIYNLFTSAGKSYDEIAAMMDLSKDRISKIIADRIKNRNK